MSFSENQNLNKLGQPLRISSFFAGIGGFDLAFERAGFSVAFHCENNDFCKSVLRRHWPSIANGGDICHLSSDDLPDAEVWTAGFPCQDLSLARTPHGRKGLQGERSGLFFIFLELVKKKLPRVVLLENVAGLLNSHKGDDFKCLLESLTILGYAVSWRVLNARYFGAPQSRPRIFICAVLGSPSLAVDILYEESVSAVPKNERNGFLNESKCDVSGVSVPDVSFCISATSGRHTGLDWARSYVTYPDAVRRLTPTECERLQGFPDKWTLPDIDYVVPKRGIETYRYHAVGNAVCVPVVSWIAKRIRSNLLDSKSTKLGIGASDSIQDLSARLSSVPLKFLSLKDHDPNSKWKSGGIAFGDNYVTAAVSSSPITKISSKLIDFIEKDNVGIHYFLSKNAIEGILRRVDKLGRSLFPPLDKTLRRINSQASQVKILEDCDTTESKSSNDAISSASLRA